MIKLDSRTEDYIINHSTPEDTVLSELYRQTHLQTVHPWMIAGSIQGKFLEMVSLMISPMCILEIGTFTGYSAICLARGLQPDGHLFTIERDEEFKSMAITFIQKAGMFNRITLLTGNAREIIPGLDKTFDLVYLDGEKDEYIEYYRMVFDKIKPGGFILADNVLWSGKIFKKPPADDHFTRGLQAFNELVYKDERVENIILPVRDGVNVIRKKG